MTNLIVHRIGRTGRSAKRGLATTFINKSNDESVLLDLKHLLMEAKQKVPTFLAELCSENEKYLELGGNNQKFILSYVKYLSILFRRKRLQLLWWFGSQNYGLSKAGSVAEQTGFKYWKKRLFG